MLSLICDFKYPPRSSPLLISDEACIIKTSVPYSIELKEKPSEDYSIAISGYSESTSSPTSDNEFYVDYDNAIIYFFYKQAGEAVTVTYYGMGSLIVADDVNRFMYLLDALKNSFYSFFVEEARGGAVRMYGGKLVFGTTLITKRELLVDFAQGGSFAVSLTEGYYKKVILGIDISIGEIAKVEGDAAPRYDATVLPSYSSDFKPVAVVTVSSDYNIFQQDIIQVRNFLL